MDACAEFYLAVERTSWKLKEADKHLLDLPCVSREDIIIHIIVAYGSTLRKQNTANYDLFIEKEPGILRSLVVPVFELASNNLIFCQTRPTEHCS